MTDWTIPVEGRRWQIEELAADEYFASRETPQAWLSPDAEGVTHVRDDHGTLLTSLHPNEKRAFTFFEPRGTIAIRVFPDGSRAGAGERDRNTIDMFDGPPPPERAAPQTGGEPANLFCLADDWEFQADSLDQFASEWADWTKVSPEGDEIEIDAWFVAGQIWLQVSADGTTLAPCDPPPSPAPEMP